jgi:hypothetical protein
MSVKLLRGFVKEVCVGPPCLQTVLELSEAFVDPPVLSLERGADRRWVRHSLSNPADPA